MEDVKKYIRQFFRDLTFEEAQHKYFIDGKPLKVSVSGLLKNFIEPFDENLRSKEKSERTGESQEELLNQWHTKRDRSLSIGKQAHLFGEFYAFNRELRPKNNYELAIMRFWNDLPKHIVPLIAEQPMYHKVKLYAGTPDNILFNLETGDISIIDYKTNEDLFKNFKGKKMLGDFSNLLDNPYNKYQLQLSYYQILLEQTGYNVSKRKIIWIKPDATYTIYDTDDLTQYLK